MTFPGPGRSSLRALLIIALLVLGAGLYLPAAGAPPLLDEAERLAPLAAGTPADALGFREGADDFRPAANLARHALLALGGTQTWIRVAAALLHGIAAIALFLIARALLAGENAPPASLLGPAAGAILFAANPICSEALLAHAAFPLVLATSLATLSILLVVIPLEGTTGRPLPSAVFFLAALLSDATIWPAAFLAAALSGHRAGSGGERRPSYLRRLSPYLAVIVVFYICWSLRDWPAFRPLPFHRPWDLSHGIASQCAAFVGELQLLFAPWGLSLDHGDPAYIGVWNGQALAGAALLAALILAGFAYGLRGGLVGLALGWFALLHLHPLVVPPEDPLSERRLYPLAVGVGLLLASCVRALEKRGAARVALGLAAAASLVLAILTINRVDLWEDPAALWESAGRANLASPRPQIALAGLAMDRGDADKALQFYEAALARSPRSASIEASIGEIYLRKGDYARALQEVNKAMGLDPSYFPAYITAGNSFMMRHQPKDAFLAFNAALRLRPNDPSALFNMGVLLFDQNRFEKAAEFLQLASEARPRDASTLFRLGMARINTGDYPGAAEALRGCVAEAPDRIDARLNLASILTQMKHFEEAGQILNGVIGSDPGSAKALNGLAVLASARGQWDKARDLFERALATDATDLKVLFNLADAYVKTGQRDKAADAYRRFLEEWKGAIEAAETARARLDILEPGSRLRK